MIVSSWTPRGKRPAEFPRAKGLWRPAALLPLTILGEYGLLLITVLGMCAGLVCVGKYGWCSRGISGWYVGNIDRIIGSSRGKVLLVVLFVGSVFDALLSLRTSVGASEKEVWERGIDKPTACEGAVMGEI